jgi:hypothetical protein
VVRDEQEFLNEDHGLLQLRALFRGPRWEGAPPAADPI